MKINCIIAAAGSGFRCGLNYNKLRYDIGGGITIIEKTLSIFMRPEISKIILTYNDCDFDFYNSIASNNESNIILIKGGINRSESIFNALMNVDEDCDYVLIHDGARPLLSNIDLENIINSCSKNGTAILYTKCSDSVKINENGKLTSIDRNNVCLISTPQMFKKEDLIDAYKKAFNENTLGNFTDDSSIYEAYCKKEINLVCAKNANPKITTIDDLYRFLPSNLSAGIGWDTHELVENRSLILGGVNIPHSKGLLGHSDADVLTHAIMDAILSSTSNKDIGVLFPDTDMKYKNISSMVLLDNVVDLIESQGFTISNISAVIMAQKPKLKDYIKFIQENLASHLHIDSTKVTISATTTEKLGLVGHEEAISSNAYCLVKKNNK